MSAQIGGSGQSRVGVSVKLAVDKSTNEQQALAEGPGMGLRCVCASVPLLLMPSAFSVSSSV